jgi:uncharacterized protein HemX
MKRFRLSTLMLLVVIAALSIAMVVQQRRAARREAELNAFVKQQNEADEIRRLTEAVDAKLEESMKILRRLTGEREAKDEQ